MCMFVIKIKKIFVVLNMAMLGAVEIESSIIENNGLYSVVKYKVCVSRLHPFLKLSKICKFNKTLVFSKKIYVKRNIEFVN